MKIENNPSQTVASDYGVSRTEDITSAGKKKSSEGKNKPSSDYDVKLSPEARKLAQFKSKMLEAAKAEPDVRSDKVSELKKKISEGTYQIDSGKIADGMLKEAIRDQLANPEA